jgi:hypothetical protein
MKPPYNTGILPLVAWYPALTYPRRSNRPGSLPVVVSGVPMADTPDVFRKC